MSEIEPRTSRQSIERISGRQRRKQHSCVEVASPIHLCAAQCCRTQSAAYSCTSLIENLPIYEEFMRVSQLSYVRKRIPDQWHRIYIALQEHRTPRAIHPAFLEPKERQL